MFTHSLPIELTASTSINQLVKRASDLIDKCDNLTFQDGRLEAQQLFQYSTGLNKTWLMVNDNRPISCISPTKLNEFLSHIQNRLKGTPIAFITGHQAFWNLDLKVNEFTLIPRQDTEILVETVLSLPLPEKANVLDLGTGTGAIALSLAQEKPNWAVVGLDKIPEAVKLAEENALLNQLEVVFLQSHWFAVLEKTSQCLSNCAKDKALGNRVLADKALNDKAVNDKEPYDKASKDIIEIESTSAVPKTFDLIVSNPPYVEPHSEYLQQGDLRFEPNSALVSTNEGFADLFHIIEQAPKFMNNKAYLVLEHGHEQGSRVRQHLNNNQFTKVETKLDYNNLPRITLGCFKPK